MKTIEIKKIKSLAEHGKYDEALSECDELIRCGSIEHIQIHRLKAHILELAGDYPHAMVHRKEVLEMKGTTLGDYYLAADNSISMKEFETAANLLQKVLSLGKEQNETWFDSASFFLLSYVQMELGEYDEAVRSLDRAVNIDPDVAMPLVHVGMCNHDQLRKEIDRRAKK